MEAKTYGRRLYNLCSGMRSLKPGDAKQNPATKFRDEPREETTAVSAWLWLLRARIPASYIARIAYRRTVNAHTRSKPCFVRQNPAHRIDFEMSAQERRIGVLLGHSRACEELTFYN